MVNHAATQVGIAPLQAANSCLHAIGNPARRHRDLARCAALRVSRVRAGLQFHGAVEVTQQFRHRAALALQREGAGYRDFPGRSFFSQQVVNGQVYCPGVHRESRAGIAPADGAVTFESTPLHGEVQAVDRELLRLT